MATIITREGRVLPLTTAEVDGNFTNLNNSKVENTGSIPITGLQRIREIELTKSSPNLLFPGTLTLGGVGNTVSIPGTLNATVSQTLRWATARRIRLTGAASGEVFINGTANVDLPLTISNGSITNLKLSNMSAGLIKGRVSNGAGVVQDLTATQVRTLLNVEDGANNYSHPNHSGDVTSDSDGATTISNNAVNADKIATDAVTTPKIENNAITPNKIATTGTFNFPAATINNNPILIGSTVIAEVVIPAGIAKDQCSTINVTVTGAAFNKHVIAQPAVAFTDNVSFTVHVSAANTVKLVVKNDDTANIDTVGQTLDFNFLLIG
jgi:hypothetical protein